MLYPSTTKLLEATDSRYSLVIAVAKRARRISEEAEEANVVLEEKPVKLAINDIADKKVKIVTREHTDDEDIEAVSDTDEVIEDETGDSPLSDEENGAEE